MWHVSVTVYAEVTLTCVGVMRIKGLEGSIWSRLPINFIMSILWSSTQIGQMFKLPNSIPDPEFGHTAPQHVNMTKLVQCLSSTIWIKVTFYYQLVTFYSKWHGTGLTYEKCHK